MILRGVVTSMDYFYYDEGFSFSAIFFFFAALCVARFGVVLSILKSTTKMNVYLAFFFLRDLISSYFERKFLAAVSCSFGVSILSLCEIQFDPIFDILLLY